NTPNPPTVFMQDMQETVRTKIKDVHSNCDHYQQNYKPQNMHELNVAEEESEMHMCTICMHNFQEHFQISSSEHSDDEHANLLD
ncbi:MAG: hypothetical protein M3036_03085, partial [Bifidobacteriales bacterium]|nr:hypothetical protein [Bifidobacteriales bacterium]